MLRNIPATNGHAEWSKPATSRAINVTGSRAEVEALCARRKTTISAIETLPGGGTRVVMMNGDDAAIMRRAFGKTVIEGEVVRENWLARR